MDALCRMLQGKNWANPVKDDENTCMISPQCPYMPEPMVLEPNENEPKKFASYYTLKYAVTEGNGSNIGELCSGTVEALDQSIHDLMYA